MGITSGILWIVFGLLYILYEALKEHPAEVAEGMVKSVVLIASMLCGNLLVRWMISADEVIGSIASVIFIWSLLLFKIRKERRETRMYEARIAEYDRVMREMDERDAAAHACANSSIGCAGKG